jgi:hypothetical protein
MPVQAVCRNCGTQLVSRYCHHCGQDLFAGARRTVKDLILNACINIFSLDNKILVTLRCLLFFPGKLSTEYARGRIVSYVHPSKLFWFIAVLLFAMIGSTIDWDRDREKEKLETVREELRAAADSVHVNLYSPAARTDTAKVQADEHRSAAATDRNDKIFKTVDDAKTAFSTYGPLIAALIVPVFAFHLHILFRRQRRLYVDHLVFAMHVHSFIFLLYALLIAVSKIPGTSQFYASGWLTFFVPVLYLTLAAYRFYRPRIWTLIWRISILITVYFAGLLVLFVLFALAIAILIHRFSTN